MRIHYFQHAAGEGPGLVAEWAAARGHSLSSTEWFGPAPLAPAPADVDLLVVLGGPMSVHDEAAFPWLRAEKTYLRTALAAGLPVLGICLGAQLLAEVLGGTVRANAELEVGVFPVAFTGAARTLAPLAHVPPTWPLLHWHQETFTLPPGAVALASSAATACQGFAWQGRVVGVQFHPEITQELVGVLVRAEADQLPAGPFVQSPATLYAHLPRLPGAAFLFPLLDQLLAQRPEGSEQL